MSLPEARHSHHGATATGYPYFDWLRILLATLVAGDHARMFDAFHPGDLAVQVFFALSGWLIGGILLRSQLADLPRFYFNRAARIWIPYFLAIALLIAASLLKEPITDRWIEFFLYKLTFVYNLFGKPKADANMATAPLDGTGNYFWSICAEEQFYLIAPILLCLLPSRWGRSFYLWLALAVLAYLSGVFDAICFGVLAAVSKHHFGDWYLKPLARSLTCFVFVISGLVLWNVDGLYSYAAPFFSISTVLLIALESKRTANGEFWGGVSYPFYLNHWIGVFVVNFVCKRLGMSDVFIQPLLSVVLGLALSVLLYLAVDRVVQQRRSGWYTTLRGVVLGITGWTLFLVGLAYGLSR